MGERVFKSRIVFAASNKAGKALSGLGRGVDKTVRQLKRVAGAAATAGAAIGAAFAVSAIRKTAGFTAAISELSAITGATGEQLAFLAEQAKRFGATTTLSASEAAEAFKLVASAKPDLLENAAALTAVTESAIILAEAAGIDLTQAALSLGESLNQFGESADEANRFINVLAAGAKFGSSEIADTSQALVNAGVAARSAGLSFEETNAAIQVLAGVGLKGSIAGSKLRSIFVKLTTQANDDFNPAVVGINKALDNLADAELNAVEIKKLFGEESGFVAEALIRERDTLDELEIKLTGTNVATEQASVRQDNLTGDVKKLFSAYESLSITVGEKWLPIARAVVQIATDILNEFAFLSDETEEVDVNMVQLEETMRAIASTGIFVKSVFRAVGEFLGGVAAAIAATLQGEFSQALDIIDDLDARIERIGRETGEKIFQINTGEIKEDVRKKYEQAVVVPILEASAKIPQIVEETIQTAGEAAAIAEAERQAEILAGKLERIRQATLTEQELLQEELAMRLAILEEGVLADAAFREEADLQRVILEQELQDELTKISNKGATDRQKWEELTNIAKAKHVFSTLESITQGVATQSTALFRINQAAAIANAIINISEGITKALALGPIVGPPLAAVIAAAGAVQIATIASASPGGGTTPSFAATPTVKDQPIPALPPPLLDQQGPGQEVTININGLPEGGLMSVDATRELIESISEQLGDGVTINTGGG